MRSIEPASLGQTTIIDGGSCAPADHLHPHLIIFSGNNSGRRHKLRRGTATIGRSPRTDISINDDRVSRVHCIIEWMGDTITIEDKASTNGTFVDSCRISRAILSPGVTFQVGHSMMKIEYKTEAEIRLEESLLYSATFDTLTGIFNRYHFTKLALMELAYASRHRLPVGIIIADIDDFKSINDTYGHPWGDFVLSKFANIVIENKRTEDLVARYGGDEFIILPRGDVSQETMHAYCERIRHAVEDFKFSFDTAPIGITVSIGFHFKKSDLADPETMISDLIHTADQALYLAKEKGRNRTESLPSLIA
jgi:two-component system cell cycle response regulator